MERSCEFRPETAAEKTNFNPRIGVAERLIEALGADYVKSGSYQDKFSDIQLSSKEALVNVVLGLQGHIRNNGKYPEELLRVYEINETGQTKINWEDLTYGDKEIIIKTAFPAADIAEILGE